MMEKNKKMLLLLLHVALLQVFVVQMKECPSIPNDYLTCYNDYSNNINCVSNNKYESDHTDNCTIHIKRDGGGATIKPSDVSQPELNKYTLFFDKHHIFKMSTVLCLSLKCSRRNHSVDIIYKPACHVKPNPPEKPNINQTTVWWIPAKVRQLKHDFQIQQKREDQPWSDPSELDTKRCDNYCESELKVDSMIQDASYVVRIRVRLEIPKKLGEPILSTWSEWSHTSSPVRVTKQTAEGGVGVWVSIVVTAAPFALFVILIFRTDRTTWVYVKKLIRGPPLPNPAKSFLKDLNTEKWQSSFFTSESYFSILKPLDIDSVEVPCAVDDITSCKQDLLPLEKSVGDCSQESQESSSSSFSNPSYSELCPVPPVCSLTAGNLEPCAADSPYGPAGGHCRSTNPEQDAEKQRGKDVDITQLLSKANNCQPLLVISDYEKVEKFQVERNRLQSADSGMCSGEEVSQESLEPDSITQSLDEEPESKKEWEEGNRDHFQKLFGHSNSGDGFSKGSIEVCSDYEQVQKLQVEIPDDVSVDSDLCISRDQQLSHHHILSTLSTRSPSDPPPTALLSFTPSPLNFIRPGSSLGHLTLIDQTAMSNSSSLEPSADGYLPVTQEES